jgi:hypothetical protein
LSHLDGLDLSYNQLQSLDPCVFNGLSQLKGLALRNNQLTIIFKDFETIIFLSSKETQTEKDKAKIKSVPKCLDAFKIGRSFWNHYLLKRFLRFQNSFMCCCHCKVRPPRHN